VSPESAPISFGELVKELGGLCAAQRTGTMFIATTDNQSARIGLREGAIVSMVFRTRRGLEAADHLRKITGGRFSFSETIVDRVASEDLPSTSALLALLAGEASPLPPIQPAAAPLSAPRPAPPPAAPAAPAAVRAVLSRAQSTIEAELMEFVGPIASVLCREHIARAASAGPPFDWPALVDAIAREIGDRAKEERFKQQALARLRNG
jgi:hypothetical protein